MKDLNNIFNGINTETNLHALHINIIFRIKEGRLGSTNFSSLNRSIFWNKKHLLQRD